MTIYATNVQKHRTVFAIGDGAAQRDSHTGNVTVHLVTPKPGAVVSVEMVCGSEQQKISGKPV